MSNPMPNPFECFSPIATTETSLPPIDAEDDGPDIPLDDLISRGFDPEAFLNDIEALPAFLAAPSDQYLTATEIFPMLEVIAGKRVS